MSIDAYGIHLGPVYVHFYALILMTGLLVGAWVTARRAKARGFDPNHIWDALLWVAIPGLIGARLYHVLTPTPGSGLTTAYYFQHPDQIFAIWNGGLGIYGAILGGVFGMILYTRRHRLPFLIWLDLAVPAVALAQAIGRWGNFVNQELYGAPSNLPWAIYIPPDKRLPGFESFSTYHPLFLYESILDLLTFVILLLIERRRKNWLRPGDLTLIYLMMYAVIRSALDLIRLDSATTAGITDAQIVSGIAFIASAIILLIRHRRGAATSITPSAETDPVPAEVK